MNLKGKKIACFLALPHHTRFFIPLRQEIKRQGGEIIFIVPLSDYPFELDLIKRNLSFKYFTDYMNEAVREKIKNAGSELMDQWSKHCFKWDGFSRWPLFKQCWFFESVVEEYFCMERFIEVEKPDLFLAHHEATRWGKVIGHLAYKNQIPYITFQEGDYYGDQGAFLIHTEYSTADLLWGNATINWLKRYQCSPDKMFPIGNTHIDDAIKTYGSPSIMEGIKKEIGIPLDKKVILFLVDIKYGGITEKEVWQRFLSGLDTLDKEAVCLFKWHPNVYLSAYEKIQEIFKELYPSAILLHMYDPYRLIAISDYCVTLGKTSLAVESLAFGKPLFALPASDTLEDYYVDKGIAQTAFPAGNWTNLFKTIKNGIPEETQVKVDRYLTEYFYKLDGKSVERAIDVIRFVLETKSESQAKLKPRRKKIDQRVVPGRMSIILPTGKDEAAFLSTLTSLVQDMKHPDWELVIVSHHPEMNEILPAVSGDVRVVEAKEGSLGALYNRGAMAATGELLVFMKPGIAYVKGEGLAEATQKGIVGIPLKKIDGTPYCLGIGFDFNLTPYRLTDESKRPHAAGGGFIAMGRDRFTAIGGFDSEIANHLIEPDLCLKAIELNIPVQYLSECLALHYKETFFGEDLTEESWKNRVRFFAKWVGKIPKEEDFIAFSKDLLSVS